MSAIIDKFQSIFTQAKPIKPGVYHYQAPADNPLNYRLHLRVEEDGSAVLLVNASTVLHLNQTAAEYAYHFIKATPAEEVSRLVAQRYRVKRTNAYTDYMEFQERIESLLTTEDLDPVMFLGFDRYEPHSAAISAPYRLDCAITYRLPEDSPVDSAPTKRVDRELTTAEWKTIIDKAWQAGIPHILFTGGEPTLRYDLVELIQHAENNGQVTGLVTDGIKLGDTKYLNALLQAGLDHTMITLQPGRDETWQSLGSFAYWTETLKDDIFVAAHLTLTHENAKDFLGLIDRITEAGVSAISLSEADKSLSGDLQAARDYAADRGIDMVWDIPVPYTRLNPVALELENADVEAPQGAGKSWLYLEPDGDVLPAQGITQVLGNFLSDDWDKIWKPN